MQRKDLEHALQGTAWGGEALAALRAIQVNAGRWLELRVSVAEVGAQTKNRSPG